MNPEMVILVDENDHMTGLMEKQEAHVKGLLHRAVSVLIFDAEGRILLQQRANHKYHSAGLWSNAACSHPRAGESNLAAAQRRLGEEMGIDAPLDFAFSFTYSCQVGKDLFEHEFDHVFTGVYEGVPQPAPEEVQAWKWMHLADLRRMMRREPGLFTPWFHLLMDIYEGMPKFAQTAVSH